MKTHKFHPVHQLDNLLRLWEDCNFFVGLSAVTSGAENEHSAVERRRYEVWPDFRRYILNYSGGRVDPDFFATTSDTMANSMAGLSLLGWNHFSRRVYALSEELQCLLSTASVEDISWNDVVFPFESFMVTLPMAFTEPSGRAFDSVLVVRSQADWFNSPTRFISITALPTNLRNRGLSKWDKEKLLKLSRQGNAEAFETARVRFRANGQLPLTPFVFIPLDKDRKVTSTVNDPFRKDGKDLHLTAQFWPEMQMAVRLVVGLCAYLEHLPAATYGEWAPVPKSRRLSDNRAISNPAQICSVSSVYDVSPAELNRFKNAKGLYEISSHWRKAHGRRPPGKGHDPTAEKTVKIPWVLVRKDRLKPGELPGGATQILK